MIRRLYFYIPVAAVLLIVGASPAWLHLGQGQETEPPSDEHKYIVFVRGIGTKLDQSALDELTGPCADPSYDDTFGEIKQALFSPNDLGYVCGDILQFSYAGGSITGPDNVWTPNPYTCADTGRSLISTDPNSSTRLLHNMLTAFHQKHPEAVFVLVGHSLGGLVSFLELEALLSNTLTPAPPIEKVITLDSPLEGVTLNVWTSGIGLLAGIKCLRDTYILFSSDAVLQIGARVDPNTRFLNSKSVQLATDGGISVYTGGNWDDCLYSPRHCASNDDWNGETFPDSALTQIISNAVRDGVGPASNVMYDLCSARIAQLCDLPLLRSHGAILKDKAASIASFIGPQ